MKNYTKVDIDNWPRKRTHEFYKGFDDPYFGTTANVNVSKLYQHCKTNEESLSLHILYLMLKSTNDIENFRMRYFQDELVLFDKINGATTLLYDDGSFGFAYYDFLQERDTFIKNTDLILQKAIVDKTFDQKPELADLVYFSAIPWISFTSFKHAQHHSINSSIPRITTGKLITNGDQKLLPLSVEVSHAIMDGYHLGEYYERFQVHADEY